MAILSDDGYAREQKKRLEEADQLYERYGKPLEAEHWGKFVAIAPDGRTLLGPDVRDLTRKAQEALGPGSFLFKVGPRIVGRI